MVNRWFNEGILLTFYRENTDYRGKKTTVRVYFSYFESQVYSYYSFTASMSSVTLKSDYNIWINGLQKTSI